MNAFIKVAGDKFRQQHLTAGQIRPDGSEVHGLYLRKVAHRFEGPAFKVP